MNEPVQAVVAVPEASSVRFKICLEVFDLKVGDIFRISRMGIPLAITIIGAEEAEASGPRLDRAWIVGAMRGKLKKGLTQDQRDGAVFFDDSWCRIL
jgi:hypothetical protein